MTAKPMKEEIKKLCLNPSMDNRVRISKAVDKVCRKYKKCEPTMKEINEVYISQEAKDFFMGLQGTQVTGKFDRGIKRITWQHVKLLFTLYIWSLIQKNYKKWDGNPEHANDPWNYINLEGTKRMLRADSNWGTGKMDKIMQVFYDMGYIDFTFNGTLVIKLDFPDGDIKIDRLHDTGNRIDYWRGKLSICPKCGCFFEKKSNNPKECCDDCKREYQRLKKQRQRNLKKSA